MFYVDCGTQTEYIACGRKALEKHFWMQCIQCTSILVQHMLANNCKRRHQSEEEEEKEEAKDEKEEE